MCIERSCMPIKIIRWEQKSTKKTLRDHTILVLKKKKRESRHHKHANVHRHLLKAAFVASLCGKLMDKVSKSATLQNITKVDSMFQKLGHSREANFLWPSLYGRQKGRKDRSPQTCWWVTFLPPFVTIGHSVTMPIYWFAKYRLLETLICRKSKISDQRLENEWKVLSAKFSKGKKFARSVKNPSKSIQRRQKRGKVAKCETPQNFVKISKIWSNG